MGRNYRNDSNNNKRPKWDDTKHYKKFQITKLSSNIDQPGSYTRLFESSYSMIYIHDNNTNDQSSSSLSNDETKRDIMKDKIKKEELVVTKIIRTIHQHHQIMKMKKKDIIMKEETKEDMALGSTTSLSNKQIVHVHVNGLCVITAGDNLLSYIHNKYTISKNHGLNDVQQQQQQQVPKDSKKIIKNIKYIQKVNNNSSGGKNKKKVQAKLIKHGGKIHPYDPLVEIVLWDDSVIILYCCVLGTMIEINEERLKKDPSLLLCDPLGCGYLGIFLPLGSFPPDGWMMMKKNSSCNNDDNIKKDKV